MKIELKHIKIRDIVEGYKNNKEKGVVGYGGLLNIRPIYQREFVYSTKQQIAVIDTIEKGFPLNVMYWGKNEDGTFEIIDGQQRTMSFCEYVANAFAIDEDYFHSLTEDKRNKILDYEVLIYICEGSIDEKLAWFETINIAGAELTTQELLNATHTGTWLSDAKLKFSKSQCAAANLSKDYVSGNAIRQELLEKALKWINNGNVKEYMSKHQHDSNADELWNYYLAVIEWAKQLFPVVRKELLKVNWGELYNDYHHNQYNSIELEQKIKQLMIDDDVTNKVGIYKYVLSNEEKHLNIRAFTESMKRSAYEKQNGICPHCVAEKRSKTHYELAEMEADHIKPWSEGGHTSADNCQMLCKEHNRLKSNK